MSLSITVTMGGGVLSADTPDDGGSPSVGGGDVSISSKGGNTLSMNGGTELSDVLGGGGALSKIDSGG